MEDLLASSYMFSYLCLYLSRSAEKQAGHDLYWFITDLLLIDSKNLAELILSIFFSSILWNMNFLHL